MTSSEKMGTRTTLHECHVWLDILMDWVQFTLIPPRALLEISALSLFSFSFQFSSSYVMKCYQLECLGVEPLYGNCWPFVLQVLSRCCDSFRKITSGKCVSFVRHVLSLYIMFYGA